MARDSQDVTAGVTGGTFSDFILLEGGGVGIIPFARQVYRGAFTLDGSGVGDTADCRIVMNMPEDLVFQLDQFSLNIEGTTDYDNGWLELYYQPSTTEFGTSVQLNYNLLFGSQVTTFGTSSLNALLGSQLRGTGGSLASIALPNNDPFNLISYKDISGTATPTLWISGGTDTNLTGGTCRFALSFLCYTFEQMNKGVLHAGLSHRG